MKRFAVFAWSKYYPAGGFHDFVESFDAEDQALAYLKGYKAADELRDGMVFDLERRVVVNQPI